MSTNFTFTGQALSTGAHTVKITDATNDVSSTVSVSVAAQQQQGGGTPPAGALLVGPTRQYTTLTAAVAAATGAAVIAVDSGTYTNDFPGGINGANISKIESWNGLAEFAYTQSPPNQKGALDITGSVTLSNLVIHGITIPQNAGENAAGVTFEGGGDLLLQNTLIYGCNDGVRTGVDANATVTLDGTELYGNGNSAGSAHNIYVGAMKSLTIRNNSYVHDAGLVGMTGSAGHGVKCRAASLIIQNSRVFGGNSGQSNEIDFPNGGALTVTNSVLQKSANSENGYMIRIAEENGDVGPFGTPNAGGPITFTGNTAVSNDGGMVFCHIATNNYASGAWNASGNTAYGWTASQLGDGSPVCPASGFTFASGTATLDTSSPVVGTIAAASKALVLNNPGTQTAGSQFQVTGSYSGYASHPTLVLYNGANAINAAAFSYSGDGTFSVLVPAQSAGTLYFVAGDSVNGVQSNLVTVTVAAQQQGGGGGGTPVPAGSLPTVNVYANSAMAVNTPVTKGHFFRKGDIPASDFNTVTATVNGHTTPVQVDQTNAWPDGSLRFAALSFLMPVAVAAGAVVSAQLAAGGSAISGTPISLSQVTSARNFLAHVGGGSSPIGGQTYGGDTFQVGFNDVVANLSQANQTTGWGSNSPVGGWEPIRSGPICSEWRAWRYLKRTSDGASHGMVRVALYVRAWSDGAGGIQGFEPLLGMQQHNSYGSVAGAGVGTVLDSYTGNVSLMDGGSTIKTFTGPSGTSNLYTNPGRGWWGADSDGRRPWVSQNGAAKPSYMIGHDQAYIESTRCVPQFCHDVVAALQSAGKNLAMTTSTPGYNPTYTPNVCSFSAQMTAGGLTINTTGDAPADPRYGWLNNNAACLWMVPLDPLRYNSVLVDGWGFSDWEYHAVDERYGCHINVSSFGPVENCVATPNAGFGTNGNNGGQFGSPPWQAFGNAYGNGTYHDFNYGPMFDFSHMPSLCVLPYLLTGDAAFEEELLHLAMCACWCASPYSTVFSFGVSGNNPVYDCTFFKASSIASSERAGGHQMRTFGQAHRMTRDSNLMRALLQRGMQSNSDWCAAGPSWPQNGQYSSDCVGPADVIALGSCWESYSGSYNNGEGGPSLFMLHDLAFMVGFEARVEEFSGFRNLLDVMAPTNIGLFDPNNGSSSFNIMAYIARFAQSASGPAMANIEAVVAGMQASSNAQLNPPATGFFSATYASGPVSFFPMLAICMGGWQSTPVARSIAVAQETRTRFENYFGASAPQGVPIFDGPSGVFQPHLAGMIVWPPGVS